MEVIQFHWADYLVFALSLFVSVLIGIFFAVTGNRTTTDILLTGRSSGVFPVAMSMLASFVSGIYIISLPAEIYYYGTMIVYIGVSYILFGIVGAVIFAPIFHKMKITSAHEYLEVRFNYVVRMIGSVAFIIMMVLYLSVVVYTPALAFSVVTGISEEVTVSVLGVVCTIYTMIGGMKAVIWTDTFQMMVIFGGVLAFIILGTSDAGGIQTVWEKAQNSSRLEFDVFDPDPRVRNTVWSLSIGGFVTFLGLAGGNQIIIQRYLCVNKTRDAQMALFVAILGAILLLLMTAVLGLIINATYSDCDPLLSATVSKPDQIVPLFMMETLGHLHGLPGLFTASVFAATLSTVSSAINSLTAVVLEDIIKPIHIRCGKKPLTETVGTWIARLLSLFFGGVTIAMSFVAPLMGPLVLQISLSIFGTGGGPLLGLFSLGIFLPCVNSFGAGAGLLASIGVTYWINIEAIFLNKRAISKPLSIAGCEAPLLPNVTTATTPEMTTWATSSAGMDVTSSINDTAHMWSGGLDELYSISYLWYGMVSLIVALVVGFLASALTCFRRGEPPIRRDLLYLVGTECCCCCSAQCRQTTNCGYTENMEDVEYNLQQTGGLDNPTFEK